MWGDEIFKRFFVGWYMYISGIYGFYLALPEDHMQVLCCHVATFSSGYSTKFRRS